MSIGALARAGAGLCDHRVFGRHEAVMAMPGMPGMQTAAAGTDGGLCPILLYAAAIAAALCAIAVVALVTARIRFPAVLTAAARVVADARPGPLTALLGVAGALPLLLTFVTEGGLSGRIAIVAGLALATGALASALALTLLARLILAFVRRLATGLASAFRLLAPGADTPWLAVPALVPIRAGVILARRRPSRAPPLRF